jgi:nuclear pore complex protein Nup107
LLLHNTATDRDDTEYDRPAIESPEDHEDILHPLREAANRVGDEVESFAKALDAFNPLRATSKADKHDMTFALVEKYSTTARTTLKRLREQHAAERRRQDGLGWRQKFKGYPIAQEEDEMELEEDEHQFALTQTTVEDLERWEEEAQTWDLLRRLISLRFPRPGSKDVSKSTPKQSRIHQYSTEREIWDDFLESNSLALERKTVLKWLKDTAEESREDIDVLVHDSQQKAERGDVMAHGWLYTKTAIKNQKRIHVWPNAMDPSSSEVQSVHLNSTHTEPLVTHLDPDAMTRQDRKLETQDQYFERAIWLGCYEMLRRGKSSTEIREWCKERTEVWRAVSMSGLPDDSPENEDEAGNPASSALWRRMCFNLARKGGGDEFERAVYGILSGDVLSVEPCCESWDDFVFAHYNALLRAQFDRYLQEQYPQRVLSSNLSAFGIYDAVQAHGDSENSGTKLVEALKINPRTRDETKRPMKMIQGVLVANRFEHFIYQQGLAISKFANAEKLSKLIPATGEKPENEEVNKYISLTDHDSLRVLTHVLLALLSLGGDIGGPDNMAVIENVIVAYIIFLRLSGKEELIPLYCSQLSGNRRYATLSRSLIDVTDHQQRETQISLMRQLGLDVQKFVSFQSRFLFMDHPDEDPDDYPAASKFHLLEESKVGRPGLKVKRDFFGEGDGLTIEKNDLLFIRSLEWYMLVDGLWNETFRFGTLVYLRFFSEFKYFLLMVLANHPQNT